MATSTAFEWLCGELESSTELDRLAARGTVRIALKQAGLDPNATTADQLSVVLQRVLPGELGSRGIDAADGICSQIAARISQVPAEASDHESPEAVFQRLGS
jgi:hypothetical protein